VHRQITDESAFSRWRSSCDPVIPPHSSIPSIGVAFDPRRLSISLPLSFSLSLSLFQERTLENAYVSNRKRGTGRRECKSDAAIWDTVLLLSASPRNNCRRFSVTAREYSCASDVSFIRDVWRRMAEFYDDKAPLSMRARWSPVVSFVPSRSTPFFDCIECQPVSAVIRHSRYLMARINRPVQRLSASPVESWPTQRLRDWIRSPAAAINNGTTRPLVRTWCRSAWISRWQTSTPCARTFINIPRFRVTAAEDQMHTRSAHPFHRRIGIIKCHARSSAKVRHERSSGCDIAVFAMYSNQDSPRVSAIEHAGLCLLS